MARFRKYKARRRYASTINAQLRVSGHIFQARLVKRTYDWRSSSGAAQLAGRDAALVSVAPFVDGCASRFANPVMMQPPPEALSPLQASETTRSAPLRGARRLRNAAQ